MKSVLIPALFIAGVVLVFLPVFVAAFNEDIAHCAARGGYMTAHGWGFCVVKP